MASLANAFCMVHGFTYDMAELLIGTDNRAETWDTVCSLWEIELNTAYNALYEAASEEGGMAYLAEYAVYLNWLNAYEQLLTAAYADKPAIAAEVLTGTIMQRAMTACDRLN